MIQPGTATDSTANNAENNPGSPSLTDIAQAELESFINAVSIAKLKGALSIRLLLASLVLAVFAGLSLLIGCGLALASLSMLAISFGLSPSLAIALAALVSLAAALLCRSRARHCFRHFIAVTTYTPSENASVNPATEEAHRVH